MKNIAPVLAIAAVSMLTGCVSYRLVERTEAGSTYALYTMDREVPPELKQEVQSSCGGPAKVVKEGEVAIGETSQTNTTAKHKKGVTYGTSTTDTTQKTEWRVTFQCQNAAPITEPAGEGATAAAAQ